MNSVCYFCDETERLQDHHIVPRRFDGSNEDENLVQLCPTCHDKIELLYNKRFYDALGVEKPKGGEDLTYGTCQVDGCEATATELINNDGFDGGVFLCEGHSKCDKQGCNKEASTMATNDEQDYFKRFCEDHAVCSYGNCLATELTLVEYSPDTWFAYCETHAKKHQDKPRSKLLG